MSTFYDSNVLPQENESIDLRGPRNNSVRANLFYLRAGKTRKNGMRRTSFGAKPPDTTENGG